VIEEMRFPVQRIQTDRGGEFVEPSQRIDLEEFWATVDLTSSDMEKQLDDWQVYYNEFRPHGSLHLFETSSL
jgi:transposase InsO family protein